MNKTLTTISTALLLAATAVPVRHRSLHRFDDVSLGPVHCGACPSRLSTAGLAQIFTVLSLRALPTTETEERLIAAAAKIGEIRMPKNGNSTPAATGTPAAL